jgi:hypothetical protein
MTGAYRELDAAKLPLDIDSHIIKEQLSQQEKARVGASQVMREQTPVLWTPKATYEAVSTYAHGLTYVPVGDARGAEQAAQADRDKNEQVDGAGAKLRTWRWK